MAVGRGVVVCAVEDVGEQGEGPRLAEAVPGLPVTGQGPVPLVQRVGVLPTVIGEPGEQRVRVPFEDAEVGPLRRLECLVREGRGLVQESQVEVSFRQAEERGVLRIAIARSTRDVQRSAVVADDLFVPSLPGVDLGQCVEGVGVPPSVLGVLQARLCPVDQVERFAVVAEIAVRRGEAGECFRLVRAVTDVVGARGRGIRRWMPSWRCPSWWWVRPRLTMVTAWPALLSVLSCTANASTW